MIQCQQSTLLLMDLICIYGDVVTMSAIHQSRWTCCGPYSGDNVYRVSISECSGECFDHWSRVLTMLPQVSLLQWSCPSVCLAVRVYGTIRRYLILPSHSHTAHACPVSHATWLHTTKELRTQHYTLYFIQSDQRRKPELEWSRWKPVSEH